MKTQRILSILFSLLFIGSVYANDDMLGKPAPDFSLETISRNGKISPKDYRGKVVLLDFWASWCGPCKKSLPLLVDLEEKYAGLKVLAVNIDDDRENALDFMKRHNLDLTVIYDSDKSVAENYGVSAMPSAVLIDRNGVVRYVKYGYTDREIKNFDAYIRELLK